MGQPLLRARSAVMLGIAAIVCNACVNGPGAAAESPHMFGMGDVLGALGAAGFVWEDYLEADKGECRTDRGCVRMVMLSGFHKDGPKTTVVVQLTDRKTAERPIKEKGAYQIGNALVIFGTAFSKRPSYEDESAAVGALRKAASDSATAR